MDSEGLTEVQILAIAPQQLNCASIDKVGAPHRHQTSTGRRIAGDCDGRPFSGTHCCGCPFYGLQADHSERSSGERSSDGSSPYYVHSEPAMPLRSRSNSALGWVDDAGSAAGFPTQRNPTILTTAAPGWRTHKRKARRVHVRGGINFRKDIIQVKKSVCWDLQLSKVSLQVLNDFVNDKFENIANHAANIAATNKRVTIRKDDVKVAVRVMMRHNQDRLSALASFAKAKKP